MKSNPDSINILVFYQYFGTPKGGWSTRFYEFARRWVSAGHQVTVVTSPYYKSDIKAKGFISRQEIEGIQLIIINTPDSNKSGILKRIFNASCFSLLACYFALRLKYDVVLASSGPITIALPALLSKGIRGKKFVFEVRDLWPKGAIELKKITSNFLIRLGLKFENLIYRKADLVVSCSPGMDEGVKSVNSTVDTLVIPNSSDNELFFSLSKQIPSGFPDSWQDSTVFIYAGSLGLMDDCAQIIEGAALLKNSAIKIAMLGDGSERELLENLVAKHGLQEVIVFMGLIPKQEVVKWFSIAKASFVTLKDISVLHTNSPNKMFDSLAAGVPVIQSTKGWIKSLVTDYECGFNVEPDQPATFAQAMEALHESKGLRTKMSQNAKKLALEKFDRSKLSTQYLEKLVKLTAYQA